ncbi:ER protein Pkr1-domain-containing protein [Syncephalis fuscata]|nr:ER protein Pkr1-domain-containing protein [Syncephalis fuscata]
MSLNSNNHHSLTSPTDEGIRQRHVASNDATKETSALLTTIPTDEPERVDNEPASGLQQFAEGLWTSIFTPGANSQLLLAMNVSFVALFLSLLFLLFASGFNGHVFALLAIAVCLFASVQWFVNELAAVRAANPTTETTSEHVLLADKSPELLQNSNSNSNINDITSKTESELVDPSSVPLPPSPPSSPTLAPALTSVPIVDEIAALTSKDKTKPTVSVVNDTLAIEEEWSTVEREEALEELTAKDNEETLPVSLNI